MNWIDWVQPVAAAINFSMGGLAVYYFIAAARRIKEGRAALQEAHETYVKAEQLKAEVRRELAKLDVIVHALGGSIDISEAGDRWKIAVHLPALVVDPEAQPPKSRMH